MLANNVEHRLPRRCQQRANTAAGLGCRYDQTADLVFLDHPSTNQSPYPRLLQKKRL